MNSAKPNIIFCHVDQLHFQALSGTGNRYVSTPAFDEIAADGISFERAISSNPICCPARTSWYTGRMSSENGVLSNGIGSCEENLPDLGKLLGAAGYDCYYGGKWHVPGRSASDSFRIIYPYTHVGEQSDETLAGVGEGFLQNYKGDKPFFLNLGFMNPHDCCYLTMDTEANAFKLGMEKVIGEKDLPPLPPNYDPNQPLPKSGANWTPEQIRLYLYTYYRMCEMADTAVGRIYQAFKNSRFFENTIFIWSADHGEMMAQHNRFGKNSPLEPSQRVPLRVVAKGRLAPGTRDNAHWIQGVDVSATIVDLAGAGPIPNARIGRSFRPLLEDQKAPWHEYVVSETNVHFPTVSFRQGDLKSIFHLGKNTAEFYDVASDPWEMRNLAAKDANPPGLDAHRQFLADYQSRVEYLPIYKEAAATGTLPKGKKGGRKGRAKDDDADLI